MLFWGHSISRHRQFFFIPDVIRLCAKCSDTGSKKVILQADPTTNLAKKNFPWIKSHKTSTKLRRQRIMFAILERMNDVLLQAHRNARARARRMERRLRNSYFLSVKMAEK